MKTVNENNLFSSEFQDVHELSDKDLDAITGGKGNPWIDLIFPTIGSLLGLNADEKSSGSGSRSSSDNSGNVTVHC